MTYDEKLMELYKRRAEIEAEIKELKNQTIQCGVAEFKTDNRRVATRCCNLADYSISINTRWEGDKDYKKTLIIENSTDEVIAKLKIVIKDLNDLYERIVNTFD